MSQIRRRLLPNSNPWPNYSKNLAPHLLMIAGGTGITPMYQIIKASVQDPEDKTQLRLIYANVNQDDIRESRSTTYATITSD